MTSYRVNYGPAYTYERDFPTFAEAVEFARGHHKAGTPVRLWRPGEVDGAEDSSTPSYYGLTRAEWEVLEDEGFV